MNSASSNSYLDQLEKIAALQDPKNVEFYRLLGEVYDKQIATLRRSQETQQGDATTKVQVEEDELLQHSIMEYESQIAKVNQSISQVRERIASVECQLYSNELARGSSTSLRQPVTNLHAQQMLLMQKRLGLGVNDFSNPHEMSKLIRVMRQERDELLAARNRKLASKNEICYFGNERIEQVHQILEHRTRNRKMREHLARLETCLNVLHNRPSAMQGKSADECLLDALVVHSQQEALDRSSLTGPPKSDAANTNEQAVQKDEEHENVNDPVGKSSGVEAQFVQMLSMRNIDQALSLLNAHFQDRQLLLNIYDKITTLTTGEFRKRTLLAFVYWLIANAQFQFASETTGVKTEIFDFPNSVVVELSDIFIDANQFPTLSIWVKLNSQSFTNAVGNHLAQRASKHSGSARSHLLEITGYIFERTADLLAHRIRRADRTIRPTTLGHAPQTNGSDQRRHDRRQLTHAQLEAIRVTILLEKPLSAVQMITQWGVQTDQTTEDPKTTLGVELNRLIDLLLLNGSQTAAQVVASLLDQDQLDWHTFGEALKNSLQIKRVQDSGNESYHGCAWVSDFLADVLHYTIREIPLKDQPDRMASIVKAIGPHEASFWHALLGSPGDESRQDTCELCARCTSATKRRGLQARRQACLMELVWFGMQNALPVGSESVT